jgi:hypothetical protein
LLRYRNGKLLGLRSAGVGPDGDEQRTLTQSKKKAAAATAAKVAAAAAQALLGHSAVAEEVKIHIPYERPLKWLVLYARVGGLLTCSLH